MRKAMLFAVVVAGFAVPEAIAQTTAGRRGGSVTRGPRGGVAAQGPRGGSAAAGPRGGAAAEGPRGGAAAVGPAGSTATRNPQTGVTTVEGTRGGYGQKGPGGAGYAVGPQGGAAVAGPRGGAAVGPQGGVAVTNRTYTARGTTWARPTWSTSQVTVYQNRYIGYPGWHPYAGYYGLPPPLVAYPGLAFLTTGLLIGTYAVATAAAAQPKTVYVYVVNENGTQKEVKVDSSGQIISSKPVS